MIASSAEEAKKLLASHKEAVLATLEGDKPFTSAVGYLYEPSSAGFGKIILLMSQLARHTKNALKHPAASLQVLEQSAAPVYEKKRVSVQGTLSRVQDKTVFESYQKQYLQVFPAAQIFFTLQDFQFFEMEISEMYFISGFGKIQSIR